MWINSFIVCVHLAIAMKHNMYDRVGDEEKPNGGVNGDGKNKHKEGGEE